MLLRVTDEESTFTLGPLKRRFELPLAASPLRILRQHGVVISETQVLVASGLAVGVGAGLGAVAFRYLIQGFTYFFFDILRPTLALVLGSYAVILVPALGAWSLGR
jgi:hypothetical protein